MLQVSGIKKTARDLQAVFHNKIATIASARRYRLDWSPGNDRADRR